MKGETVPVRFTIEEVFDLRQREVIVIAGRMLEGTISGETTLWDERTGGPVKILGVELMPRRAQNRERVALIVDPTSTTRPAEGMVLVSPA